MSARLKNSRQPRGWVWKTLAFGLCCASVAVLGLLALQEDDPVANKVSAAPLKHAPTKIDVAGSNHPVHLVQQPSPPIEPLPTLEKVRSSPPGTMNDINGAITKIDQEIDTNNFIDRANDQSLSVEERQQLRELLRARDRLFEKKIQLLLEET